MSLSCERAVCLHVFLVDVLLCIVEKGCRFAPAKASFIAVVRAYMFIYGLMCCFDGPLALSCFTTL